MILFPNCKINLGLSVLRKREDGFHDLQTVFYPLPFTDVLEIVPVAQGASGVTFDASGLPINGSPEDNLCVKAYYLLQNDFASLPPVLMQLHKVIPMGAGLGGGSADGAFVLRMINELAHLQLTHEQLLAYAARLGSDCPFFILNKPCFATDRGEQMQEIALDLSPYAFVLVHPQIHVNTGWAFSQLQFSGRPATPLSELILQPPDTWKCRLVNDFEAPVFAHYPAIGTVRDRLYEQGAVYAAMSGSGSTVFGIFRKEQVPAATLFPEYRMEIIG